MWEGIVSSKPANSRCRRLFGNVGQPARTVKGHSGWPRVDPKLAAIGKEVGHSR